MFTAYMALRASVTKTQFTSMASKEGHLGTQLNNYWKSISHLS